MYLVPAISQSNCPEINLLSHQTQNNMGNSSYLNSFWADFFLSTIKKNLLDIKKPILIVGGGYGAGVVELLQLGANTIYFNDLDARVCAPTPSGGRGWECVRLARCDV